MENILRSIFQELQTTYGLQKMESLCKLVNSTSVLVLNLKTSYIIHVLKILQKIICSLFTIYVYNIICVYICVFSFGSQAWDYSFYVYKLYLQEISARRLPVLKKAHEFLKFSQVRVDPPNHSKYFRHISKGVWTSSARDHG